MSIKLRNDYSGDRNEVRAGKSAASVDALLEENLELTKEIHKLVKKIRRHLLWAAVWSWIKIIIILVPLILAFIYGQKFFSEFKNNPQKLMENSWITPYISSFMNTAAGQINLDNIDIKDLPSDYQKYIK